MSFFAPPPRLEAEIFSRLPDRYRKPRRTPWADANRRGASPRQRCTAARISCSPTQQR